MRKFFPSLACPLIALAAVIGAANQSEAVVWSLADDFSYAQNSDTSTWSYRLDDNAGNYALLPMNTRNALEIWGTAFPDPPLMWSEATGYWGVGKNLSGVTQSAAGVDWAPNEILFHPENALPGRMAFSWLAPGDMTIDADYTFGSAMPQGNGIGYSIVHRNAGGDTTLIDFTYIGMSSLSDSLDGLDVAAGDRLYFRFDNWGNAGGDISRAAITIKGAGNELVWNGDGPDSWDSTNWELPDETPTVDVPNIDTTTTVKTNVVTVDGPTGGAARSLAVINNGGIAVAADKTLTVATTVDFEAGTTLALANNATLVAGSGGVLPQVTTAGGTAIIDTGGSMELQALNASGSTGSFAKQGDGELSLLSAGNTLDTTFETRAGTLTMVGDAAWGESTRATLAGGELLISDGPLMGIFVEDFNDLQPTVIQTQADTGLPLTFNANLPGWTKQGGGAIHGADRGNGTGDWSMMTIHIPGADNIATLDTAFAANDSGVEYRVAFEAGPTVYGALSQKTLDGDQFLIELLNPAEQVVASFAHAPGAWAGEQTFSPVAFTYIGDGTGDVRLRISPVLAGPDVRFTGAIDNLIVDLDQGDGEFAAEAGPPDLNGKHLTVTDDSTLTLGTTAPVTFGGLTMAEGTLTTSGMPVSFAGGTLISPAEEVTAVGFDPQTQTDLGPINGGGATIDIRKIGSADLALDDPGSNLGGTTFVVEEGRLIGYHGSNPFGTATLKLAGGELLLSAKPGDPDPTPSPVDYKNAVIVEADATISAGPGDAGHAGPMAVNLGSATKGMSLILLSNIY